MEITFISHYLSDPLLEVTPLTPMVALVPEYDSVKTAR